MSNDEIQPEAATNAAPEDPTRSALVVVDVQEGFNDPSWGQRNNPACEANIAALLAAWRQAGEPIVFVRHDSQSVGSPLLHGQPGNDLQPLLTGDPDLLVTKSVNSAFMDRPTFTPGSSRRA